jgi:hypothetical protein
MILWLAHLHWSRRHRLHWQRWAPPIVGPELTGDCIVLMRAHHLASGNLFTRPKGNRR